MTGIRVGLLGAGYILKAHARAVHASPDATLHAVCDVAVGRARAAAAEYGIPRAFGSLEELAASDVDAVHILLPPSLHIAAARQLLEAGKHVFLEKPMGPGADDCLALCDLAEARGLTLAVNHNFLFAPAYQAIREGARSGALGPIDYLTVNWLYALPLLQFGPFNSWMVARPGNLVLELGSHLAAFALDLLGDVTIDAAVAANPVDLPGQQRVFRRWTAMGTSKAGAALTFNLSVTPGQTDRSIAVRAMGASAHFDFERGVAWQERQSSDNPIFDNVQVARAAAKSMGRAAMTSFGRYLARALRKQPAANPFEESIALSVGAFYAGWGGALDPRLRGRFGAATIRLCEDVIAAAGQTDEGMAAAAPSPLTSPTKPRVLVVGGTGFIGRRLVEKLAGAGTGVRVLTRSLASARIDLAGLDVELVQGSHADPVLLEKALDGIDTVYHLAKAEGQRWQDYLDNDLAPTRTLAEATLKHGIRRFIYTGTIDSYASANPGDVITGDTPVDKAIATRNLYARSKAGCEALLKGLARTRGLPLVIFRPGVVIGPGSPPAHLGVGHFVSNTRVDYWGDGANHVPFVLVEDVADALALALDAPGIEGQEFLLTDEPLLTARDYVAAIEARSGLKLVAAPRAVWRYWLGDAVKEAVKHAIRHPNRRASSLHDFACKAHRAGYDSRKTRDMLGWRPAGTRGALIERGIDASVDRFMR